MVSNDQIKETFQAHLAKWGLTVEFSLLVKKDGFKDTEDYLQYYFTHYSNNKNILLHCDSLNNDWGNDWNMVNQSWRQLIKDLGLC